jgi:hypothetical protein
MTRLESQIANFMATLHGLTLDEALGNLELDARSYGWPRATVRAMASEIRIRYARNAK